MIRPVITLRRKRVIIDVDTQKDLFLASSPACIRNHRRVLANIRRVIAWSRLKNVRMISTAEIHEPNDLKHSFCLDGTEGQNKLSYTIRNRHTFFEPIPGRILYYENESLPGFLWV